MRFVSTFACYRNIALRISVHNKSGELDSFELAPSKIIAVGRNYRAHAEELGNAVPKSPLIFFKPPSAVIGSGSAIVCPGGYERVDYEGELAVVIGKRGRNISESDALGHVFGASCLNDVTVRDLQKSDGQWTRAKGFDTFCPIGPRIACGLELGNLEISTRKNGETVQQSNTRLMVHSIAKVIAFISAAMTLEAGDVIATGTPAGVGPIAPGDVVEIEIEGIGVLRNDVVAES